MIDAKWLEQLRIELGEGYRLDGVHIGGTWAACKVDCPDGKSRALRLPRMLFEFPGYVREVPNWLAPSPQYDVDRLNRKLTNALGDPQLHVLVRNYDKLFTSILETCYQDKISDLDRVTGETELHTMVWRFIIQTPAVRGRLDDYATRAGIPEKREWAVQAIAAVARLGHGDPLAPDSLFENPFVVWGGAVAEGFFTKSEFPSAAAAVARQVDSLPDVTEGSDPRVALSCHAVQCPQ